MCVDRAYPECQAQNTIDSLLDGNFRTGICAHSWIRLEFSLPGPIRGIKVGAFFGNTSAWCPTSGKSAKVECSQDGSNFTLCGTIPASFGAAEVLSDVTMICTMEAVKYLRYSLGAYIGLSK